LNPTGVGKKFLFGEKKGSCWKEKKHQTGPAQETRESKTKKKSSTASAVGSGSRKRLQGASRGEKRRGHLENREGNIQSGTGEMNIR